MQSIKLFLVALFLSANSTVAFGVCLEENGGSNRHPTVNQEVADSVAVLTGSVVACADLSEDAADPGRISATVCKVRSLRIFRGKVAKTIEIRSENDSGRFPLDVGKRHLLFVTSDDQGYYVDNCGNSGLVSEKAKALAFLSSPPKAEK